jgi:hypothetical protein
VKWNEAKLLCSTDQIIKNKNKKGLFKIRKRQYIYIIAGQNNLKHLINDYETIMNSESLADLIEGLTEDGHRQEAEDVSFICDLTLIIGPFTQKCRHHDEKYEE